ncbi:hypothetical protein [Paenibacillus hunanensis]|uniref:Flp pilus assembly protein TadB n=1 Tax=Paenibacillus hunanensis TaxID=539262 RepID=A0ABU1IW20_9BACL|nr:hypothetical protein [Paenibacillus hunanensis]MDR6243461.1 Flp pilus assembly protein TadB [Paenibacillus hunanensis]GGI97929.1 hypothetical protein GCM10008022_03240 [Paenibacillus hunanensis]
MSILISISAATIFVLVASLLLPGFSRHKDTLRAFQALQRVRHQPQSRLQRMIYGLIDQIIPEELRKKYEELGEKKTLEAYLTRLFLLSLLVSVVCLIVGQSRDNVLMYVLAVLAPPMLLWAGIQNIDKMVKKNESLILGDLPLLFDRMEVALETGKSFQGIWMEVSQRCKPALARHLKELITNSAYGEYEALQQFADRIRHPVVYNLVSVIMMVRDSGFESSESALRSIQTDMRSLRRASLQEKNRTKPALLNVFVGIAALICLSFMIMMASKIVVLMNGF